MTKSLRVREPKGSEKASLRPHETIRSAQRASFSDVTCREVDGAAPFDVIGPVFGDFAELAFQLRYTTLDRGLPLVNQVLGLFADGEVRWWAENGSHNSNQSRLKSFGDLATDRKTGIVGLIKRQGDHDGRICHAVSPSLQQFS
jgi:hypothetical protein